MFNLRTKDNWYLCPARHNDYISVVIKLQVLLYLKVKADGAGLVHNNLAIFEGRYLKQISYPSVNKWYKHHHNTLIYFLVITFIWSIDNTFRSAEYSFILAWKYFTTWLE